MFDISTGSREFKNSAEITALNGFVPRVGREDHRFLELIGFYQLGKKDQIQCGICGAWHMRGYVVSLSNAAATIIGHMCGNVELGDNYSAVVKQLQRRRDDVAVRIELNAYVDRIQQMKAAIASRRSQGSAVERVEKMRTAFHEEFAEAFVTAFKRSAQNGIVEIVRNVKRTSAEVDYLRDVRPDLKEFELTHNTERVGYVRNVGVLSESFNERLLFAASVVARLERAATSWGQRPAVRRRESELLRDCRAMDDKLRRLDLAVTAAAAFFSDDTMRLLPLFMPERFGEANVRNWVNAWRRRNPHLAVAAAA